MGEEKECDWVRVYTRLGLHLPPLIRGSQSSLGLLSLSLSWTTPPPELPLVRCHHQVQLAVASPGAGTGAVPPTTRAESRKTPGGDAKRAYAQPWTQTRARFTYRTKIGAAVSRRRQTRSTAVRTSRLKTTSTNRERRIHTVRLQRDKVSKKDDACRARWIRRTPSMKTKCKNTCLCAQAISTGRRHSRGTGRALTVSATRAREAANTKFLRWMMCA